jgi:hypothetical protein
MPLNIPKEHFKILTDKNSRNGKPFLTIDQYDLFIQRAFCGNKNIQKQKFNKAPREHSLIRYVFYEFYYKYCFDYFDTMQCQEKFIKLLVDNFERWDYKKVNDNFSKNPQKTI